MTVTAWSCWILYAPEGWLLVIPSSAQNTHRSRTAPCGGLVGGLLILVEVSRTEQPGFYIVLHLNAQDVPEQFLDRFIENRANDLDTVVEIPLHPVGGRNIVFGLTAVAENIDRECSRYLSTIEKSVDVITQSFNARLDNAHAAG